MCVLYKSAKKRKKKQKKKKTQQQKKTKTFVLQFVLGLRNISLVCLEYNPISRDPFKCLQQLFCFVLYFGD